MHNSPEYLTPIDTTEPEFGDFLDELSLWSAPFGLELLKRVPVRTHQTILDIGAGTGFLTLELAQRCGESSTVIAVDPWAAAMVRLQRKSDRIGMTNLTLLQQDATDLPLRDQSVDVIVSNLGLNNFEDADAVLRTCRRVARDNATLVATTNLTGHMHEFYDVFREVMLHRGMDDRIAMLDMHIAHRGTIESVTQLLNRNGFEILSTDRNSFSMRFANGSTFLRHQFIRLGFMSGWKAIIPTSRHTEFFTELESCLNESAIQEGELSLTIPMACITAQCC